MIGKLCVEFEDASSLEINIDTSWKATDAFLGDEAWMYAGFDDSEWDTATKAGEAGDLETVKSCMTELEAQFNRLKELMNRTM